MGVTDANMLGRTPYYVMTGGLAVIFLFPILWAAVASVSPQAGTGQTVGIGLGNYTTLSISEPACRASCSIASSSRSWWSRSRSWCPPSAATRSPVSSFPAVTSFSC